MLCLMSPGKSAAVLMNAVLVQACALPVVYRLLTAQDKGAQRVAIEMLTFLCEMGSEWQTQEQLTLANFDKGVILAHLVERIERLSNQTRLSTAKAAELARLLQLLSSATSGNTDLVFQTNHTKLYNVMTALVQHG